MSEHHILQLKEEDFIAKGSHNLVYRHPDNHNLLVKILGIVKVLGLIKNVGEMRGLKHRLNNSRWIGTFDIVRHINRFRLSKANVREFMEIVRLRFDDEFLIQPPPFMQKVSGFVDTNLGFAMIVQAEKDAHGNYAPTLSSLIEENRIDDEVRKNLDQFCRDLLTYDLILSDLHPDNMVYSWSPTLGNHFVIIDGIGDKNIIPILRLSRFFRNRAKKRKIRQLQSRVA